MNSFCPCNKRDLILKWSQADLTNTSGILTGIATAGCFCLTLTSVSEEKQQQVVCCRAGGKTGTWIWRRGRLKLWGSPTCLTDLLASLAGLVSRGEGGKYSQGMPARVGGWHKALSEKEGWRRTSAQLAGHEGREEEEVTSSCLLPNWTWYWEHWVWRKGECISAVNLLASLARVLSGLELLALNSLVYKLVALWPFCNFFKLWASQFPYP